MFLRPFVKPTILAASVAVAASGSAQTGTTRHAAPATSASGEVSKTANPELVGLLSKELGVTPKQAEAGAGAIFGYAKKEMKPADYAKVEKAVPGIGGLEKAAPSTVPEAGKSEGTLGALTGAASQLGGGVGAAATLAPSFQKIGLNTETLARFLPIVVGYVTNKGGSSTGDLLAGVLGTSKPSEKK